MKNLMQNRPKHSTISKAGFAISGTVSADEMAGYTWNDREGTYEGEKHHK